MAQGAGKQRSGKSGTAAKTPKADYNGRSAGQGASQHMTDLEFLRGLIDAVDQSGIDSLEINRAGTRIRIAKTPAAAAVHTGGYPAITAAPAPPPVPGPMPEAGSSAATAPAAAAVAEPASAPASNVVDVKSPMVGTFYRAPAPDAPPYVEVGSTVSRGQTLCILEAMKLMNELECEQDGIVREILVTDSDPVEYGQVLFRIEPSGSK
jgi:acetyl-CoA carboxylase biotin carboxyl carrier protein